jgi:hypothetical protein
VNFYTIAPPGLADFRHGLKPNRLASRLPWSRSAKVLLAPPDPLLAGPFFCHGGGSHSSPLILNQIFGGGVGDTISSIRWAAEPNRLRVRAYVRELSIPT